jgi:Tol biopolymer transport system component
MQRTTGAFIILIGCILFFQFSACTARPSSIPSLHSQSTLGSTRPLPTQTASFTPTSTVTPTPTIILTPTPTPTNIGGITGAYLLISQDTEWTANLYNFDGTLIKNIWHSPFGSDYPTISWSPDGTQILVEICYREGKASPQIWRCDIAFYSPSGSLMTKLPFRIWAGMAWSPNGTLLAYTDRSKELSRALFTMRPDGSNITEIKTGREWHSDPIFSPDGSRLIVNTNAGIISMNLEGSDQKIIGKGNEYQMSPDHQRVVYVNLDKLGNNTDIFTTDQNGNNRKNLTNSKDYGDRLPMFSPDGKYILFSSYYPWADPFVYSVLSDGSAQQVSLGVRADIHYSLPHWSPDGQYILFYGHPWEEPRKFQERPIACYAVRPDLSEVFQLPKQYDIACMGDHQPGSVSSGSIQAERIQIETATPNPMK